MQDKKLQCPYPGQERRRPRWSGQSFIGEGAGVSRAHSNWFHAVAITLPRTVKSSKWGCARAPHMSPALGHTRGHYLLPRVSLHQLKESGYCTVLS